LTYLVISQHPELQFGAIRRGLRGQAVGQAGRDAMATDRHRNSTVSGSGAPATAAELAAAAARQRARHVALMLMAASTLLVIGGILLLLWWLA
jgi:hypothetical protein